MNRSKLSNFYVRSGLFGILSLIGALLSYSLYPVLVHVLNTQNFGDFAVIAALSNQLLGVLAAFNIISIYLVKTQPEEKARQQAQILQKALIWLFLIATVIVLISSHYLKHLLKVQHISSFLVLAMIMLVAVPGVIWTGYLQGHKELVRVGIFNLVSALVRLVLATLLALKLGTFGGLLGMLGGTIVGLAVLSLVPGVKLPSISLLFDKTSATEKRFLYSLKRYFIECLVVVGILGFLQNYDITLAKALFNPNAAGIYSGVSILSNALYYLCFLLIWIVLPELKLNDKVTNHRLLGTAYKLLGLLAVVVVVIEIFLKNFITHLLLGHRFSGQGEVLIFATLYQLTLVAITLYVYYLLVNRRREAALLTFTVVLSCAVLPLLSVSTPLAMIRFLWLALLAGVGSYLIIIQAFRLLKSR